MFIGHTPKKNALYTTVSPFHDNTNFKTASTPGNSFQNHEWIREKEPSFESAPISQTKGECDILSQLKKTAACTDIPSNRYKYSTQPTEYATALPRLVSPKTTRHLIRSRLKPQTPGHLTHGHQDDSPYPRTADQSRLRARQLHHGHTTNP